MLHTASPLRRMAVSFQWPYRSFWLIYSSARLMPPVKAVWPSMIQNFRWSRLFMRMEITGLKRLKQQQGMPVSASNFLA